MPTARVATLKVPGASLHYEVQGSGPVLLIIPGMPADAGLYSVVARRLADAYTVVTYDPRGISRSRLDGGAPSSRSCTTPTAAKASSPRCRGSVKARAWRVVGSRAGRSRRASRIRR
jgi:pimeloyl-ACP methyl ester carboxylesterase